MEFECWTGLRIEGKSYIIAEKISYKEKTSDDVWTEYGLITTEGNDRTWLTIADGGLSCILSTLVKEDKPPKGYHLHDTGTQVVTGVWGDTDAAVGDMTKYEQYESADGSQTFFVEKWSVRGGGSAGKKLNAADIVRDEDTSPPRWNAFRFHLKNFLREMVTSVAVWSLILLFVILTEGPPDLSPRTWHDFRNFAGLPYSLHERLSDAPYYTEVPEEGGARIYTAQMDAGAAALDLIEGMDGNVQDAFEDAADAEHPIVIRTETETARIVPAPDGTARIAVRQTSPNLAPATDQLKRDHTLVRYAALVRTGDPRGRASIVTEGTGTSAPATAADTASPSTSAAEAAPAQTPTSPEGTPRHTRYLAH